MKLSRPFALLACSTLLSCAATPPPPSPADLHACVLAARHRSPDGAPPYPSRAVIADPAAHARFIVAAFRQNAALAASHCGWRRTLLYNPAHCGLGDRARGMVTTFYMALLTHSGFGLDWHTPFALDEYFDVPDLLVPDAVAGGPNATVGTINNWGYYTRTDYHAHLASLNATTITVNANSFHWKEVVDHPVHQRAAEMYGLAGLTRQQLYRIAFSLFFGAPKPFLRDAVASVLVAQGNGGRLQATGHGLLSAGGTGVADGRSGTLWTRRGAHASRQDAAALGLPTPAAVPAAPLSPRPWLAVQLRTGGVGEVWEETRFHRHPLASAACFAREARSLCEQMGGCRLFLTADSAAAAAEFKARARAAWRGAGLPPVTQAPGLTLHADQPVPASMAGTQRPFTKTFVDWLVLSQADALLMSHSGFGWTAGWGGGVPYMRQLVWGRGAGENCTWVGFNGCALLTQFE